MEKKKPKESLKEVNTREMESLLLKVKGIFINNRLVN